MPIEIKPEALEAALKLLRLHGFALIHYGGDALHQGAGTPTIGETWRDNLTRACNSIANGQPEAAWQLGKSIEFSLFDLNRLGETGVAVAKAINDLSCKSV